MNPPLKTTHRITVTAEYLRDAHERAIQQKLIWRMFFSSGLFRWLPCVLGAAFTVYLILAGEGLSAVLFGSFTAALIVLPLLNTRFSAAARARNALIGTVNTFTMGEGGLQATGPTSESRIQWAGIVRAVTTPQGALLTLQTGRFLWLPDASLTEGSPQDVRQLLSQHVKDCTPRF